MNSDPNTPLLAGIFILVSTAAKMSQILSIYLRRDTVHCARFEFGKQGQCGLVAALSVARPGFVETEGGAPVLAECEELRSFLGSAADDEVVALMDSDSLVIESMNFPFSEERKIEAVLRLQLEEELPFDVDDYFFDFAVGALSESGEFQTVVAGVTSVEVAQTLQLLRALSLDPAILTIPSVGLASLHQGPESVLALAFLDDRLLCSCSDGAGIRLLRERSSGVAAEVMPILLYLRQEQGIEPVRLVSYGKAIGGVEELPAGSGGGLPPVVEQLLRGIALARFEKRKGLINFRKGQYKYRGSFRQILTPLWEERPALMLMLACLVLWIGSGLYADSAKSSVVDNRFQAALAQVFPGEVVPAGRELSFVDGKVAELESRLQGLGSVSALSPLEALKELSELIKPNLDIAIDTISLTTNGVTFSGSVADNATVGRLIGIFESNSARYCSPKVDPRGQTGTRIKVMADLKYCP